MTFFATQESTVDESGPHYQQKDHEPVSGTEETPAHFLTPHTNRGVGEKRFCVIGYYN